MMLPSRAVLQGLMLIPSLSNRLIFSLFSNITRSLKNAYKEAKKFLNTFESFSKLSVWIIERQLSEIMFLNKKFLKNNRTLFEKTDILNYTKYFTGFY